MSIEGLAAIAGATLLLTGLVGRAAELSAVEVVERARDMWRGETFHGVVSIEVTRFGQTEAQRVEVWAQGTVTEHYRIAYADEQPEEGFRVRLVPLAGAPVEYGELRLVIDERFVIREVDYYDQRGNVLKHARVLELEDRLVPQVLVVEEHTGQRTVVTYEQLAVDVPLPEDVFTLEYLKQP